MARKQDVFTLLGKRMQIDQPSLRGRRGDSDMPPIADLIRRIDRALVERRAAGPLVVRVGGSDRGCVHLSRTLFTRILERPHRVGRVAGRTQHGPKREFSPSIPLGAERDRHTLPTCLQSGRA